MHETDEKLYEDYIADNDENALRLLLEKYREPLTLFLKCYVRDINDAEDLMLDTFAVIASKKSRFRGKSSFKTWLFAIAYKLAMQHLRKMHIQTEELSGDEETTFPADYEILREEQNKQLYMALNNIKDDYRQILFLLYFEEITETEAALVMKKNKGQIYHLVSRGKEALKKELERMGFDYAQY